MGEGLETAESLKLGEGEGDLGFVVGVGELVWFLLVELLRQRFVGVDLQRERLGD